MEAAPSQPARPQAIAVAPAAADPGVAASSERKDAAVPASAPASASAPVTNKRKLGTIESATLLLGALKRRAVPKPAQHTEKTPQQLKREEFDVELKKYKDTDFSEYYNELEIDPLKWWREKGLRDFPLMAKFARKLLAVQATSVPSERVNSLAGQVCTDRRCSLTPEHASMLIYLGQNSEYMAKSVLKAKTVTVEVGEDDEDDDYTDETLKQWSYCLTLEK